MKKLILSLVAITTIALSSFGQAPEGFKYQAVVRDAGNTILNNQAVGMRMTIQQGSIGGTTVYQETFAPTTNAYGLVNLEIGSGTVISGDFTTIDWANGPYFIETAVDVTGGTSYAVMGTSQLLSVPYALHAKTAENVTNDMVDDADADPTNELQDWSNLPGIPANIDTDATDDFSGDYNDLTNQPTIPTVPTNVSAFTNDAGYLTTEVDGSITNEIQTISRTGTTVTLSNGGTFEDSVGVYTAGTGIDITNNVISSTDPTYTIGLWPELGGYVFWVSADNKHGLVAETVDQGYTTWYEAQNTISNPANHSADGQKFRDWRMPTKYELNEMYLQQAGIGGFSPFYYWGSSEGDYVNAWEQSFGSGGQYTNNKNANNLVRSVRAF